MKIMRGQVMGLDGKKYAVRATLGNIYWCSVLYQGGKTTGEGTVFNQPNGIIIPYAKDDAVLFATVDYVKFDDIEETMSNELPNGYILGKINNEKELSQDFPLLLVDDVFFKTRTGAGIYFNHKWNSDVSLITGGNANGHVTMIANRGHFFFGESYLPFGLHLNKEEKYSPEAPYVKPPKVKDNEVLFIHDKGSYIHLTREGTTYHKTGGLQIVISDTVNISSGDFEESLPIKGEITIKVEKGGNKALLKITDNGIEIEADNITLKGKVNVQ